MRRIYVLGSVLGALALLGVAAVGSASAATTCRMLPAYAILSPKYASEAACLAMTPEASSGEWMLVLLNVVDGSALTAGQKAPVRMTGTLVLEDMAAGTEIECSGEGTGELEAEGMGVQKTATATSCKALKGFCGTATAEALNLPWELEMNPESSRLLIAKGTGGEPGYKVTCSGIILDSCTGVTSVLVENMSTETPADMLSIFSATESEAGNCSVGGSGQGLITGELLVESTEGLSISIE